MHGCPRSDSRGQTVLHPSREQYVGVIRALLDEGYEMCVDLTATEFKLLATLAASPGRIFTRSQLLDALRGVAFESYERAIDSHIKNLRRKIEPDPARPTVIRTVRGAGYLFAAG